MFGSTKAYVSHQLREDSGWYDLAGDDDTSPVSNEESGMDGQLKTIEQVNQFIFAGNSTFTLVSLKTGTRFTYRVRASDDGKVHFVSVLTGADNEGDFAYLGSFHGPDYFHGKKSKINPKAPSAMAFKWFAARLSRPFLPRSLEFWHTGRCGRCGRKLTVPSSVSSGLGPSCAQKMGIKCEDPTHTQ